MEYCTKLSHLLPEIKPDVIQSANLLCVSSLLFNEFCGPLLLLESPENDFGHRVSCILKTGHFVLSTKPQMEGDNATLEGEKRSV